MSRRPVASRDRFVAKMTVEDDKYCSRIKQILLEEPCRGLPSEPSQLLNNLYLGNQSNAESLRLLRRLGITHVLNCAGYKGPRKESPAGTSPYEGLGIDYHEFQAEDNDCYNLTQHFPEAFSFLERAERRGGKCLVHCAMGVNRSAATCVAYMLHAKRFTLLRAIRLVKEKRRVTLSNIGFRWQLVRFARSKGLLERLDEVPAAPNHTSGRSRHDWFVEGEGEEAVYEREPVTRSFHASYDALPSRQPQAAPVVDRFPEFSSRKSRSAHSGGSDKQYATEVAKIDLLSKCINDTLARESAGTGRRTARGRLVTRE